MENEPKIIAQYVASGQVKIVARMLAQSGEVSLRAAEAAECGGEQGKFWQMRSAIFVDQSRLFSGETDSMLTAIAAGIGLDTAAFGECLLAGTYREPILRGFEAAKQEGIRTRPVFDINGSRLIGAQPYEEFVRVIDAALP